MRARRGQENVYGSARARVQLLVMAEMRSLRVIAASYALRYAQAAQHVVAVVVAALRC